MSQKGSKKWFDAIIEPVRNRVIGIEVSHYSKDHDVIPRCQVTFVFNEFFFDKLPEDVFKLRRILGFRGYYHVSRGTDRTLRTTVAFDFRDNEKCPRKTMLSVAKELGLTAAPGFLNTKNLTARYLPSVE